MKALLLVDIQNDFCTNGKLAVKQGEIVVPIANKLMNQFELVVASQDWHPQIIYLLQVNTLVKK